MNALVARAATVGLALVALAPCSLTARSSSTDDSGLQESDFLNRTRQLIYEGRRSGEGYFSPDGRYMVFQSEREKDNPFYQIYRMDRETGDSVRVSSGVGKTTCSFIQPGTGAVLFSSTHHDPKSRELQKAELDFRASGKERRYSWDYDPEMDLYLVDPESASELGPSGKRLTQARGYDAEASFSPDGQWIVFSSNRTAYDRELSKQDRERLEIDPAYFADLYVMKADGSDLRQLTDVPGYDGGPFFFPDGKRIIWRRFTEDGLMADVWSMRPDGSDQKKLTDFGAMSWAPYVHPSGQYVLFASNKLGFSNFEIFLVDVDGAKEPVRVTYTDGFDGLPVPTPDGKELVFTSSRGGGAGAQLYIAQWNHERALEALASAPERVAAGESP